MNPRGVGFTKPIQDLIRDRFSCRTYLEEPIARQQRERLAELAAAMHTGPLGSVVRYRLVTADDNDRRAFKGLGTYGFVRGATGFLIGASRPSPKWLEDYGYRLEQLTLHATDLGLGTCWLGGSFARSRFESKIDVAPLERVPAVLSVGRFGDEHQVRDAALRRKIGAKRRLPWESLFFSQRFDQPLCRADAGSYEHALEMVRLGPSASNKQPWRILKDARAWHFFVQRTPGYRSRLLSALLRLEDLQRIDLGIAMCHFELTALELGLEGHWSVSDPGVDKPSTDTEYTVTWQED